MKILLVLLTVTLLSCDNKSAEHPCLVYIQNIQALEDEIDKLFQKEGKLKEELESAKLYIQTLEYENKELLKLNKKYGNQE